MQVATFIVHKIILDEAGLQYICATPERFFGIAIVLARMVAEQPSTRLLKHIVRCYLRLTDDPRCAVICTRNLLYNMQHFIPPNYANLFLFKNKKNAHLILCCRAHIALQTHLPEALRDGTFDNGLRVSLVLDSSAVSNQPLPHLN